MPWFPPADPLSTTVLLSNRIQQELQRLRTLWLLRWGAQSRVSAENDPVHLSRFPRDSQDGLAPVATVVPEGNG